MKAIWRALLAVAGLMGAAGVAAAAAASHGESRNLAAIATIFLAHGPVLVALALHGKGRALLASGLLVAFGSVIFGADLIVRELWLQGLFSGAAPLGGALMILGWLCLCGAALLGRSAN